MRQTDPGDRTEAWTDAPALPLSVIVPVYNELPFIEECVASIRAASARLSSPADLELIVVDNGSDDGTFEWLRDNCSSTTRLLQSAAGHVGAVRNRGASEARGQILVFVDGDCEVTPSFFSRILDIFGNPKVGAAGGPHFVPSDAPALERAWQQLHSPAGPREVAGLDGCNFAVRRSVFRDAGGFREDLVTGEDSELAKRIAGAGHVVLNDPSLRVVHLDAATSWTAFVAREFWRGKGMLATWSGVRELDKPLTMTVLNSLAVLTAVVVLAAEGISVGALLLGALLVLAIPVVTVLYRVRRARTLTLPLHAVLAYTLYYWARGAALFHLAFVRVRRLFRSAADVGDA